MASSRNVTCPLCKQTIVASSEAECIEHMSSCQGFSQRHGEEPRKTRAKARHKALPDALESAQLENRTREYSNDGTFKEQIPEALLDALHWWKDETQAQMGATEAEATTTTTSTAAATTTTTTTTTKPWKQDDGTDRFYWYTLLCSKPSFVSIYAANECASSHLITDPTINVSQTAREQCALDNLCTFSPHACSRCGLAAKLKKARCAQCKVAYYCSSRCQQAHWKEGHRTTCGK